MGSGILPALTNISLNRLESSFLSRCPEHIKPSFCRCYLDTFLLFDMEEQAHRFFQYVNTVHNSIKFTFEREINNRLSFLDVDIYCTGNQFITSVFRKPTFTSLSTNYISSVYHKYKSAAITTLLCRAFMICSTYALFHKDRITPQSFYKESILN